MSKLVLTEQSVAPTTPSSGKLAIYAKTDGKAYAKNDAGVEYDLTTGGAGGEDLAATLVLGNTTGGTDIVLSDGDHITGESGSGIAGNLLLLGGTSSDSGTLTDGGSVVVTPGAATAGGDDGGLVLMAAVGTNSVVLKTIGDEVLRIGTTLPFEYDGITGKLTIPGIIDPTAIVFEEADAPTTGSTEGAVFVSDGTGGLTLGHLYFVPPSSGTPVDISNPAVAADTLQAAYNAGRTIVLGSASDPIELTAGATPASLLAFKKLSGDGLFAIKHAVATRVRLEGAVGAAATAGTSIELVGGAATGPGDLDGGSVYLRPGTRINSGIDGSIAFLDVAAAREVDVYVDPSATYPAPVLLSRGTGTVGVTLGPVVNALNVFSASALGVAHLIPNNASVCLYNPNSGLGPGARYITLPANPVAGQTVVVKDVAGNAGTYNVTIAAGGVLIDGAASVLLSANWKAFTFVFNQNWYII